MLLPTLGLPTSKTLQTDRVSDKPAPILALSDGIPKTPLTDIDSHYHYIAKNKETAG